MGGFGTKTKVPEVPTHHVTRPRLLAELDTVDAVATVVAPAGYGKSILVAQWARATDRSVAWMTVDEADQDPARFWCHAGHAIGRVAPELIEAALPAFELPSGAAPQIRLAAFLEAAAGCVDRVALVVDEYHRCSCPEVDEAIEYLLKHRPSDLSLVLLSRNQPPISLQREAAEGRLLELGVDDLRFDVDEVTAVLSELGIDRAPVAEKLWRYTGGWPVMVSLGRYMLGRGAWGGEDPLTGNERLVAGYLTEEVMRTLDPERRAFVTQTSILDQVSGPLADAVVDGHGGGAVLEELAGEGFPIHRLDEQGEWFCYHDLVARRLRTQLRRTRSLSDVADLHRRAARWYEREGSLEVALGHALEAGDHDYASDLYADYWLAAANQGEIVLAGDHLAKFPESAIADDPRLGFAAAWLAIMSGSVEAVRPALRGALAAPARSDERFPGAKHRSSAAAMIECVYYRLLGETGPACAAGRKALEIECEADDIGRARALAHLGVALFWRGHFQEAETVLEMAVGTANRFRHHIEHLLALGHLALVALQRNERDRARRNVDDARQLAAENRLTRHPAAAASAAAAGELSAIDEDPGALDAVDRALEIASIQGEPAMLAYLYTLRARVADDLGRSELAERNRYLAESQVLRFPDVGFVSSLVEETPERSGRIGTSIDLTAREITVLRLMSTPQTLSDIARELYVSHNTVKTHARNIYRKLGVAQRADAVREAAKAGLL